MIIQHIILFYLFILIYLTYSILTILTKGRVSHGQLHTYLFDEVTVKKTSGLYDPRKLRCFKGILYAMKEKKEAKQRSLMTIENKFKGRTVINWVGSTTYCN